MFAGYSKTWAISHKLYINDGKFPIKSSLHTDTRNRKVETFIGHSDIRAVLRESGPFYSLERGRKALEILFKIIILIRTFSCKIGMKKQAK